MACLNSQSSRRARILIASPIDAEAIEGLRRDHDVVCAFGASEQELRSLIHDREVLVFRSGVKITAAILKNAPRLALMVRAGCGLDNLELDDLQRARIRVFTIPGPGAQAVAEMAIALMLALARNLREADRLTRQGHWAKHELQGHLLCGKVLGIVGCGNIGARVGQLGRALGMTPVGCVEGPTDEIAKQMRARGIELASIEDVVAGADFLSIHVPLTDATRNLIGPRLLSRMKPGSFLVNLARGGVVDEPALYDELVNRRKLLGAALDVHQHEGEGHISPLATLPNVLLTPHIGAMTVDTQREIGRRVAEIIAEFCQDSSVVKLQSPMHSPACIPQLTESV